MEETWKALDNSGIMWRCSDRCRWRIETSRIGVKLPRSSERLEQVFSASGIWNLAVQGMRASIRIFILIMNGVIRSDSSRGDEHELYSFSLTLVPVLFFSLDGPHILCSGTRYAGVYKMWATSVRGSSMRGSHYSKLIVDLRLYDDRARRFSAFGCQAVSMVPLAALLPLRERIESRPIYVVRFAASSLAVPGLNAMKLADVAGRTMTDGHFHSGTMVTREIAAEILRNAYQLKDSSFHFPSIVHICIPPCGVSSKMRRWNVGYCDDVTDSFENKIFTSI
ncbi:hypothetical protein G5I_05643 [Acromyrmex echinatior]|uniref:Uncharacterized protein n=1 Tax=Acromyrmex echinatior TaxID=103372 RepID=F4WIW7_ACREC|nr:hypothetical protein G5I_05643 [Acromyrmex echinatior]